MNSNCRILSFQLKNKGINFLTNPLGRNKFFYSFHSGVPSSTNKWCFLQSRFYSRLRSSLDARKVFVIPNRPLFSEIKRVFSTNVSKNIGKNASSKRYSVGEMKRLLILIKPEKWNLSGAILLLLCSSTITMSVPFALGKVIDLIYATNKETMLDNLNKATAILLLIFILGAACNFGRVYIMNISAQRTTRSLREKVFSSIIKQEVAFFDYNKTGDLVNRLSADTSVVSNCITLNISDGLRSLVMVGAGISMMFYMSVELALVSLAVVPPVAGMAIIYGRYIKRMTTKVQDALADATQVADERIANIRTVKSFSKEDKEIEKYQGKMAKVLSLATKESFARGLYFGMAGLSGNAIVLLVLYYGGTMVTGNKLTVGDLSAFLLYAAYIGVSLGGLTSFYSELSRGLGASTRLWQLMDRVPTIPAHGGTTPLWETKGDILFEDIIFSYPGRKDVSVLNEFSLHVPSSKVTAVVGSSGTGKSTLAALLLRLYDPDFGNVKLDGVPVKEYDPHWLRSQIGFVSQEPILFSGSVKENVVYGAEEDVSEDRIVDCLNQANALGFVSNLPQGMDTLVGERGIMLSGGQKQRVAIARALIKNPKILLLDEATSALDAESEHFVQEALEEIMKGRTVLIIAHRLSTIRNADQIAVLVGGKVAEIGSYESLMKVENGVFRKLVKHQTFQEPIIYLQNKYSTVELIS